jgi:hypothetical protein
MLFMWLREEFGMKSPRHNGRPDDRILDFVRPNGRLSERSALHRYLPPELTVPPVGEVAMSAESDDGLDPLEFRARWWPAPDMND